MIARRFLLPALACLAPGLAPGLARAEAPSAFGRWFTDDRSAIVAVAPCGEKLCGRIERVLDPRAPKNDVRNPDRQRRASPLVGTLVLRDYVRAGEGWKDGQAYDPKAGRSYRSELKALADGRLQVTGCVLFVCQSRYWTRAR